MATPQEQRGPTHHPIIDEFSERMAPSDAALARLLAHIRKYGLFRIPAHQRWGQVPVGVQGALQNWGHRRFRAPAVAWKW